MSWLYDYHAVRAEDYDNLAKEYDDLDEYTARVIKSFCSLLRKEQIDHNVFKAQAAYRERELELKLEAALSELKHVQSPQEHTDFCKKMEEIKGCH
jgi:lysyl-tRNA synthetase class I